MCGLGGYINISQKSYWPNHDLLEKMQQSVAHRGPNGYRIWMSDEEQLALFHRRLSIVDLSDAAFQPFFDAGKTVAVLCNGEIYNHPQLRSELESLGACYTTNSDTETIMHAYKQWGIQALERLEGMFVIVLYDFITKEFFLIRDRYGIKPIYFSLLGDVLSFASEIKALWQLPWISKELNVQAMSHYLTYLATPAPMTLYKNIYKMPAGHYLKVDAQKNITYKEWYNPLTPKQHYDSAHMRNEEYCIQLLRSLLRKSVKKHLMSDVPYGAFLSGGIDSSLNVALMSELVGTVKTFTIAFSDDQELSEFEWARSVAKRFSTEHHELLISEKEAFEFFEKMIYHQDEPLADTVSIPLYYIAKLLKDSGTTVALIGEGSDELFCGYSLYGVYLDVYNRYWKHSQKYLPALAKQGIYSLAKPFLQKKLNRLDAIKNWAENKNFFWSGAVAFSELWKKEVVRSFDFQEPVDPVIKAIFPYFKQSDDSYAFVEYHLAELYNRLPNADFFSSMMYLELKHRLPELLLTRVDKITMATSVEARVPFLDDALVEFAFQIPTALKYRNGVTKYILKKAAEGIIPNDIIYRKKMGFVSPTTHWFKQGTYFKTHFLDSLNSVNNKWADYLNISAINELMVRNQTTSFNGSVQLWTLQNLMAHHI